MWYSEHLSRKAALRHILVRMSAPWMEPGAGIQGRTLTTGSGARTGTARLLAASRPGYRAGGSGRSSSRRRESSCTDRTAAGTPGAGAGIASASRRAEAWRAGDPGNRPTLCPRWWRGSSPGRRPGSGWERPRMANRQPERMTRALTWWQASGYLPSPVWSVELVKLNQNLQNKCHSVSLHNRIMAMKYARKREWVVACWYP